MKRLLPLCVALAGLRPLSLPAADFNLALGYAQSRDFWDTVQDVQNQTGRLPEIQNIVKDRYGRPDVLYFFLDASYSYPHSWFDSETFSHAWIGTRAEALAGGEVSNPLFPEIQAYANTIGIASYGFHSRPDALGRGYSYWSWRVLGGVGREKRLFAKGPELIDAIPVRTGTLLAAGTELVFVDQSDLGDDFRVTSNLMLRPLYFHSSADPAPSFPDEPRSFMAWRWRIQSEWLKQVETPLSSRTRLGLITVAGQTPVPFTSLPVSWDYQQRLQLFPGFGASSGLGGILRFLTERSLPSVALYFGIFGGGLGGGADLQLGPVLLNASSYSLENALTASHDRTRLWQITLGASL